MTTPDALQFIPQMQPWFDDREKEALSKYMETGGWITEFTKTKEFAQAIADYTGTKYCSILSNGTVTLTAALIAMGIGKNDEVIVPDYTMIASANAVLMAGATPVFADVERATMCLDLESLKSKVTPATKAIMLVSINGRYPAKLDEMIRFCRGKGLKIVEDAAQSLGSFFNNKHVGTFGDIGSFSFSMPKIITTGQGGALITDNEELYHNIELVRNFGRENAGIDKHVFYGVNFKFTDLQAVVGIEQMRKISERVRLKREIFKALRDQLSGVREVEFLQTSDEVTPWFNDVLVQQRDALQVSLKQKMIGSRPFYPAVHTQAPYNITSTLYPHAEYFAGNGLWLPSYAQLSDSELDRIVKAIKEFYNK